MERVVNRLIELNKKVATMESCTGGGVADAITSIEGSSQIIGYSAVTYSNEAKIMVGVNPEIIEKYTVYSSEVAREMARVISIVANADYGIGITGKLNRADENNMYGADNQVFYSIYDKALDTYYTYSIVVTEETRPLNKKLVIDNIEQKFMEVLKQKTYGYKKN